MRILLATHLPAGRGADFIRAWSLGREMAEAGHAVTLAAGQPAAMEELEALEATANLTIESFGALLGHRSRGLDPVELLQRLRRYGSGSFDVVHTFGPRPMVSLPAIQLRRSSGAIWIADWSDRWGRGGIADERSWPGRWSIGWLDHWTESRMMRRADGVTVVSPGLERLVQNWGVEADRILDLEVGAAVEVIRPGDGSTARESQELEVGRTWLIYTGQSAFDRGYLRKLLPEIVRRQPQVRFLLVGTPQAKWDDVFRGLDWRAWAACRDYVPYQQLGGLYASAAWVFLPLASRGAHDVRLPLRIGDAMAAGRPIMTTAGTEAGRFVTEHDIGVAVDGDADSFAEALASPPVDRDHVKQMGVRARRLAESEFAWSLRAERLLGFYRRLLAGSR